MRNSLLKIYIVKITINNPTPVSWIVSLPPYVKILSLAPCSKTIFPHPPNNRKKKFSCLWETIGQITCRRILIFTFIDRRRSALRFWNWTAASISWRKFWVVTVLHKYLNFATFTKGIKQATKPKLRVALWHKLQPNEVPQIKQHFLDVARRRGMGVGKRWVVVITGLFNEANREADFISYNAATVVYWVQVPIFHAKTLWQDGTHSREKC